MKKGNRWLAVCCCLTMLAGSIVQGGATITNASEGETKGTSEASGTVESVYEIPKSILESYGYTGGSCVTTNGNASIRISDTAKHENLKLYINATITDAATIGTSTVELAQNEADREEIQWNNVAFQPISDGTYQMELAFKDVPSWNYTTETSRDKNQGNLGDYFTIDKEIKHFRIYGGEGVYGTTDNSEAKVIINRVWIEDTAVAGLSFGQSGKTADTYLQLENPLSQVPKTIEASIKSEPKQAEWVLGNRETLFSDTAVGVGEYVTAGDEAPGAELTCLEAAGEVFFSNNFKLNTNLNINIEGYEKEDLALSFWCYSESDGTLGDGTGVYARLGNNTHYGDNFLQFTLGTVALKAGWNKISIPLTNAAADINFAYNTVRCFGFIAFGDEGELPLRRFTDFKLGLREESESEWILGNKETLFSDTADGVKEYVTIGDEAPGAGLTCVEATGKVFFSNNFKLNTSLNINIEGYEKEDLALSFWCYSESDGTLGDGTGVYARLGNNTHYGDNFLQFTLGTVALKAGWNKISIPLTNAAADINFAYNTVRCFGFIAFGDEGELPLRRFTDFRLERIKVTTETVNGTELSSNNMVFSNVNGENEANPYAFFITEEGYPSLLVGTKQVTLRQDVRTGEWVDLAAAIGSDNCVSFYVDGKFAGKSVVAIDMPGVPTTAHCIGADGRGKQIMKGSIADIRLWNDERTAEEISENRIAKTAGNLKLNSGNTEGLLHSWFLVGDIQYVTKTMPDTVSENNAVYRGSRADDWVDYNKSEYSFLYDSSSREDYWSLVFVPDIQSLTNTGTRINKGTNGRGQIWNKVSQWIADNIETENIQHVMMAGDATWNNTDEQYTNAFRGMNRFVNDVPTSVMIGNHDYAWGETQRNSKMYQSYFGEGYVKESKVNETYAGCYKDSDELTTTENSYYRFDVNGVKWMILQLEYRPRFTVLEWAADILEQYPLDNVILATHGYIDGQGEYITDAMSYVNNGNADSVVYSNEIWEGGNTSHSEWKGLKQYTNIKMLLCGHAESDGVIITKMEKNVADEAANAETGSVPALMINAQDIDMNDNDSLNTQYYSDRPVGLVSIFRFSADGKNVAIQWYSPVDGKSYNAGSNQLSFEFDTESSQEYIAQYTKQEVESFRKEENKVTAKDGVSYYSATAINKTAKPGYVFAGWFTDEMCTKPLTDSVPDNGVYARFIDKEVLSVKAQISTNLLDTDLTNDASGSLRFVTSVDSTNYQLAGFKLVRKDDPDDSSKDKIAWVESKQVYRQLYAFDGKTTEVYQANDVFAPTSKYFKAVTMKMSSQRYSTGYEATAYVITRDGTIVYGESSVKKVTDNSKSNWVYVSSTGKNAPGCGTELLPYETLEYALNHVPNGGTIKILDSYTVPSGFTWKARKKTLKVEGGTLNLKNLLSLTVNDNVTFANISIVTKTGEDIIQAGSDCAVTKDSNVKIDKEGD